MKHILNPFILFLNLLLASICQVDAQSTIVTDVFTPADATESVGHHSYNQIKKPSGAVYSMKVINTYSGKAVGISKSVKGSIYTTQTNGILKGICIKWYTGNDQSKNKLELYSSTKPYDELKDNDNPIYNDSKKGQLLETFSYNKQETYYDLSDKNIRYVALKPHNESNVCYLSQIEFVWEVEVLVENQVAPPTFDLDSNVVCHEPLTLHLSCATPGASIYYTLDGSIPSEQSTLYREGGILLTQTTTVKAIALKEGMLQSQVSEATYTFDQASDYFVYKKVTSTDELKAGDTFVLVGHDKGKDYVLSYQRKTIQNKEANNRQGLPVTFDANGCVQLKQNVIAKKIFQNAVYELELKGESGKWLLYDPIYKGYLYAPNMNINASGNLMNTSGTIYSGKSGKESSYLDISFAEEGRAILDFHHGKLESGKYSLMCYGDIFSCYNRSSTNASDKVYLYRKVKADEGLISMSGVGFGTLYLDKAFTMPVGLQGGIITQAEGSSQLNVNYCYPEGKIVPARTPLFIKGAPGVYLYCQTASNQQPEAGNLLHGEVDADGLTSVSGASYYYKLSYNADGKNIGFYWGAPEGGPFKNTEGKAYLALPASAGSLTQQAGFSLDEMQDITGITLPESLRDVPPAIYLIDGRRVLTTDVKQLPKGLYIINGQKQLIY